MIRSAKQYSGNRPVSSSYFAIREAVFGAAVAAARSIVL